MAKLYERIMQENRNYSFMREDELHFVLWAYQQLEILLGDQSFKTLFGVPQGGINSPILYFLTKDLQSMFKKFQKLGLIDTDQKLNEQNMFLFADDSVFGFHLATPVPQHKDFFRTFLYLLQTISMEWGLKINWDKSAIMKFMLDTTTCHHLSDCYAPWKGKGYNRKAILGFNMSNSLHGLLRRSSDKIKIPFVKSYKYLGIYIASDLRIKHHIEYLKPKINYICNSFASMHKASFNMKFCYSTWTTFIRPLLDYASLYSYYAGPDRREKLQTLYRTSLRKMLFLKNYTKIDIVDPMIQYNYKELPQELRHWALKRWDLRQRRNCPSFGNLEPIKFVTTI